MSDRRAAGKIAGRRLALGAQSLARVAWLLGLDQAPERFRPTSAGWIEDHLEIAIPAGGGRDVVFRLARAVADEKAFVTTEHLTLTYRAKAFPAPLAAAIRAAAERRLVRVTLEDVADFVAADPELGAAGLPMPAATSAHPAHQLDTWGAPDAWADFFARGEVARSQLDSIDPSKLFRFIQHCDSECLLVNPYGLTATVPLIEYPWADRARAAGEGSLPKSGPGAPGRDDDDDAGGEMMTTDLDERDVIFGNPGKVRAILEKATSRKDAQQRMIFFSNTCVPTVTGEDVESVVREFQAKSDVPLLYLTVTPKAMNDVFRGLLVERRLGAEATAPAPDPNAVNLIGFPDDRATGELVALLARFGVRVHTMLLPELDVPRIEGLAGASLNVFRPNEVWAHYFEQLRERSRTPHVTPPAPYGREGTRRWLATVLDGLGRTLDPAAWDAATLEDSAAWDAACARARQHRLGLVVRGEELQYLTDPAHTWGVPLLELTREAGFGLDLMLYATDARTGRAQAEQVVGVVEPGSRWTIHLFPTFDALDNLLQRSACEAVLTHYFFDWRLSQAGKNRFSLQHFEMGLTGGVRTVQRLVAACELPFYKRYRRFLRRTPEGLRAPATRSS